VSYQFQELVDQVYADFGTPATLTDSHHRLLAFSIQPEDRSDWIRRNSLLDRDIDRAVQQHVNEFAKTTVTMTRVPGIPSIGLMERVIYPIAHRRTVVGYLYLIDPEGRLTLDSFDPYSELLELIGRQIELERLSRFRTSSAIAGLLSNDPIERGLAADILGSAADDSRGPFRIAVVSSPSGLEGVADIVWARLFAGHLAWTETAGRMVAILEGPDGAVSDRIRSDPPGSDALSAWPARIAPPVLGIGGAFPFLTDLHTSYRQALRALRYVQLGLGDTSVSRWEDLGAWRPLLLLPREEALSSLDGRVAELIEAEPADSLTMVQRYLERDGDIASIAAEFHLHRTTLYARLRRLQERFGLDWEDPEDRLASILGIRVGMLYPNEVRGRLSRPSI
jgi:hypothetical protein